MVNCKFLLPLPWPSLRVEANRRGTVDLFLEHIKPFGPSIDTNGPVEAPAESPN